MRRALLLLTLWCGCAYARDGGTVTHDLARYLAFMEEVRPHAPGLEGPSTMVLARLAQDDAWLTLFESGAAATLLLPSFSTPSPEMATALSRLTNEPLAGFFAVGTLAPPVGSTTTRELKVGHISVKWIEGALPFAPRAAPSKPTASPQPAAPMDVTASLQRNLAHLPSARRVSLSPALRAYETELATSMGATRLDPKSIRYEAPLRDVVLRCERAFLDTVAKDLSAGTSTIVTPHRRHGFVQLFTRFNEYEAQVVGWSVGETRYVFFKYRLPSPHLPPLDREYHVNDGGAAYFEYQCRLPTPTLFNVYVHGEA